MSDAPAPDAAPVTPSRRGRPEKTGPSVLKFAALVHDIKDGTAENIPAWLHVNQGEKTVGTLRMIVNEYFTDAFVITDEGNQVKVIRLDATASGKVSTTVLESWVLNGEGLKKVKNPPVQLA